MSHTDLDNLGVLFLVFNGFIIYLSLQYWKNYLKAEWKISQRIREAILYSWLAMVILAISLSTVFGIKTANLFDGTKPVSAFESSDAFHMLVNCLFLTVFDFDLYFNYPIFIGLQALLTATMEIKKAIDKNLYKGSLKIRNWAVLFTSIIILISSIVAFVALNRFFLTHL